MRLSYKNISEEVEQLYLEKISVVGKKGENFLLDSKEKSAVRFFII